jgi:hypothetical protein
MVLGVFEQQPEKYQEATQFLTNCSSTFSPCAIGRKLILSQCDEVWLFTPDLFAM